MQCPPKIVAVLNITPDSFSDGGEYLAAEAALARAEALIAEGADVLDVGAESTRPGAQKLTHEQEWQRLQPVLAKITALCHARQVAVSLDSFHPKTVGMALGLGVDWINDVAGFADPAMVAAVKNSNAQLVVMHSLSVPADKNIVLAADCDPVQQVCDWARARILALETAGIARSRIIFDPGIGFGKTAEQSWELVRRIGEFSVLGVPLLVGHSRKSFLGAKAEDRDAATLHLSLDLARQGVQYVRVHDVAGHIAAFKGL